MAQQVTLEEAASLLPEPVRKARGGQEIVFQEIVFTEGRQPVARLVPVGDGTPTPSDMARIALAGGVFGWLANEPDLYDDTCGEAIW